MAKMTGFVRDAIIERVRFVCRPCGVESFDGYSECPVCDEEMRPLGRSFLSDGCRLTGS